MSKIEIKGEYIPTEEDIKNLEQWLEKFHDSCFPKYNYTKADLNTWDREHYDSTYIRLDLGITNSYNFYTSKAFPFIMKTNKGPTTVQLKIFKLEKDFQKFIYNSGYLIHRCLVGRNPLNNKTMYACYYHKDFGKVGWLKGRSQFVLQKFCSVRLLQWFYGIYKIKCPNISITITNKCGD